jgi:hypothetical protein
MASPPSSEKSEQKTTVRANKYSLAYYNSICQWAVQTSKTQSKTTQAV